MIRSACLALSVLALTASLSVAEPSIRVYYSDGVPYVELEGNYLHSIYTVYRASSAAGPWETISNESILCLGSCYTGDRTALPGTAYWYRFDLLLPEGRAESYGPYAVTFSPAELKRLGARVYPNPVRGPATVEFFILGAASDPGVKVQAALFDAQGRRVRHFYSGSLPRGLTSFSWDGRDDHGASLRQGMYFLRLKTPTESAITRVIRAR